MKSVGLIALIVAAWPFALLGADNRQPAEFKGVLRTGIMAIGGETTGTVISVKGGKTYELDLGNLRGLAEKLNGKEVVVQGTLRVKAGVEIKERRIITVTGLRAAGAKQEVPAAPKAGIDTARVTGTFVVPKRLDSFDSRVVEIQLFNYDPRIADKAADLVDKVEIKNFAHKRGTNTNRDFVIGAQAALAKDRKYYLTLFILKDGHRTHMGEVLGKSLCTVLTYGEPNDVMLTVRPVR